jgi:hypothetical protein
VKDGGRGNHGTPLSLSRLSRFIPSAFSRFRHALREAPIPSVVKTEDVMKQFGINIQEWLRVAFNVPVVSQQATVRAERTRMNRIRRTHRPRNGSLHPRCVYLEFVNRRASRVAIAGSFNNWRPTATPMIPMGGGWWVKGLVLPPGRHEYRFIVDDQEMPDPNASQTARDSDGRVNSVLFVPEKAKS